MTHTQMDAQSLRIAVAVRQHVLPTDVNRRIDAAWSLDWWSIHTFVFLPATSQPHLCAVQVRKSAHLCAAIEDIALRDVDGRAGQAVAVEILRLEVLLWECVRRVQVRSVSALARRGVCGCAQRAHLPEVPLRELVRDVLVVHLLHAGILEEYLSDDLGRQPVFDLAAERLLQE